MISLATSKIYYFKIISETHLSIFAKITRLFHLGYDVEFCQEKELTSCATTISECTKMNSAISLLEY